MHDGDSAEHPRDRFTARLDELASAVESSTLEAESAALTQRRRRSYWLLVAFAVLTMGLVEVELVTGNRDLSAPLPPGLGKIVERDPCTARLAEVADAIAAYNEANGVPPPNLQALAPGYFPRVPLDPESLRPYRYEVTGDTVSLSCPR